MRLETSASASWAFMAIMVCIMPVEKTRSNMCDGEKVSCKEGENMGHSDWKAVAVVVMWWTAVLQSAGWRYLTATYPSGRC